MLEQLAPLAGLQLSANLIPVIDAVLLRAHVPIHTPVTVNDVLAHALKVKVPNEVEDKPEKFAGKVSAIWIQVNCISPVLVTVITNAVTVPAS